MGVSYLKHYLPRMILCHLQIVFGQVCLPVQDRVMQLPPAPPSGQFSRQAGRPERLLSHAGGRRAPNELSETTSTADQQSGGHKTSPFTRGTLFSKHVAVQLGNRLPGDASAQVQPVDVLADDVLDVAGFEQLLERHVGFGGNGIVE